jgi:hypothetical protein
VHKESCHLRLLWCWITGLEAVVGFVLTKDEMVSSVLRPLDVDSVHPHWASVAVFHL